MFVRFLKKTYQLFLSPALHTLFGAGIGCRFEPSCSQYAHDAISIHGYFLGGWLSLRRLLSCHPCSSRPHFDPVPQIVRYNEGHVPDQTLVLSKPCDKCSETG